MTNEEFEIGWKHFCKCVNFNYTALDAESIRFMNEMPAQVSAALLRDAAAASERKCRVCGCSDFNACPGPCYWVEDDLCSECAPPGTRGKTAGSTGVPERSSKK